MGVFSLKESRPEKSELPKIASLETILDETKVERSVTTWLPVEIASLFKELLRFSPEKRGSCEQFCTNVFFKDMRKDEFKYERVEVAEADFTRDEILSFARLNYPQSDGLLRK